MTRTISHRLHGIFDYVLAAITAASPWLFGFSGEPVNCRIAVILGCAIAFYSFCTDYEVGVLRGLPLAGHLFLDMLVGIFLGSAFMHISMSSRGGLVFAILGVLMLFNVFHTSRPTDTPTS
jgi:hypothetical protein